MYYCQILCHVKQIKPVTKKKKKKKKNGKVTVKPRQEY